MKAVAFTFLAAVAAPALAQPASGPPVPQPPPARSTTTEASGPGSTKVNQLIIYGNDPCPASAADEIIVCARKPEGERYRIPENLRELGSPKTNSWLNQATELSYVGRTGTDSCSTVGAGGFTGCLSQIINAASADRENRDSVNWNRLIEDARQARLGTIDERTEAIEQQIKDEEQKPE